MMYKKYRLPYLSTYLYFLISFNVLGFLNLIGRYFIITVLSSHPRQILMRVMYLFAFLIFPFVVLSIYLFFSLIRDLLEKRISALFNKIYFPFWAVIFLVQVLFLYNYYDTNNDKLLIYFLQGLNVFAIICLFLTPLYFLFKVKDFADQNKKKAFKNFGLIYLLYFAFTFIVTSKFVLHYFGPYRILVMVVLFFSLNLPSLLYLKYYLSRYHMEPQLQEATEADLEEFLSKYEISRREQEIIHLMLKGKSNKEIMDELFISLYTVKNHIYNIYQKLGVKNRLQINNLIRSYLQIKK